MVLQRYAPIQVWGLAAPMAMLLKDFSAAIAVPAANLFNPEGLPASTFTPEDEPLPGTATP